MHLYDIIAIMFMGLSHVMLYFQLIRYHRLSYIMLISLSIVFTILVGIVVTVTGYPEFNSILLVLFLLSLGLLQIELTIKQNLYCVLVSILSISLVKTIVVEFGMNVFMWTPFPLYEWTASLIHLITSIIIAISIGALRKQIQQVSPIIMKGSFYYISYLVLVAGLAAELMMTLPANDLLASLHKQYGQGSYSAAFILFFILLLIVLIASHVKKEKVLAEQQKRFDGELLNYVEKLEVMHDDLANFRHDYMNILLTLDEGVRTKNITEIEHIYHEVIAPTSKFINNRELDIVKLAQVEVPEVKSVLSVKLTSAQQQHIQVTLDIPKQIKEVAMPIVHFIRIITILIDNGIEEAIDSKDKILYLSFFEMEERQYFIVRNSYQQKTIDLEKIYEKRYSSKEEHHGYGLYSLKRMIDKTDNAILETTCKTPYFTQTLIMKKQ